MNIRFPKPAESFLSASGHLKSEGDSFMTTAEKLFQDALVLDKEGQAERAFTLYLGAAELGFVPAQLSAGVACMSGRGTAQNYEMAVFWLEKAAAQNNACAIANLAYCYCNGYGVARSETKALELYRAAANLGDSNASRQYDLLRSKLAGSASSPAAAPAAAAKPAARRRRPPRPAAESSAEDPELDKIIGQVFSPENPGIPTVSVDVHQTGPQSASTVVSVFVPEFGRSAKVSIPNSIAEGQTITFSAAVNAAANGINSPLRIHVGKITRAENAAPAGQAAPQRTQAAAAPVRQAAPQQAQASAAPARQAASQSAQPAIAPDELKKKIRTLKFRIYLRPVLILLATLAFVASTVAVFVLATFFPKMPIPPMLGNLLGIGFSVCFIPVFFAWFFPWVIGRYPKPGFFKTRRIIRHLEKRKLMEKAVLEMETCTLVPFGDKMLLSDSFLFPKKKNGVIIPCDEILWMYAEYSRRRHYGHLMLGTKYWGVMGLTGARGGKKYSEIINSSGHAMQRRVSGILLTDTKENRQKYKQLRKKN